MTAAREEGPAAGRWRRLVTDRLDEMQRLSPTVGSISGSFWGGGRAEKYDRDVAVLDVAGDPLLRRLRRLTTRSCSAIDVGAGTGRFALPLAQEIDHVIAVDPAAAMLAVLERRAGELGVDNVTSVNATWADAEVATADVVFSSYAVSLVADGAGFVAKLDASARERVLLYLGAYSGDAVLDPLWRHFHDVSRAPGPSYLDALAIVHELGIEPSVKVCEIPNRRRYATLEDAVESYRDGLLLPDSAEAREDLRRLLGAWLLGRTGALRSPLRTYAAAIIEWRPRAPS